MSHEHHAPCLRNFSFLGGACKRAARSNPRPLGGDYSDEEFEPDDDDDDDVVPGSESISEIASEVYSDVDDDPTDPLDSRGSPTEIPRRSVSPSPGTPIPAANAATPTPTPPAAAAAASPAAPGSSGKAQIAAETEAALHEYRRVTEKKLEGNKQTVALEYERKLSLAKQQLEVKNAVAKDDAEQKAKEELAAFKADLVNSTETERGKVRQLRHHFGRKFARFSAPHFVDTRRVCSTWCPCGSGADWCLEIRWHARFTSPGPGRAR